ncbi:hypothetical protein EV647_2754 [Kribbella sp. VKM Ac-2566]|nr:hypothetical protein EV647_2754 [Kribbella sp. VKM Ac-2566]
MLGWSKFGFQEDNTVLLVPISSFDGVPKVKNGDVELDWKACGLNKPSWARARRIWGANPHAVDPRPSLGHVTANEMALILLELEAMFMAHGTAR